MLHLACKIPQKVYIAVSGGPDSMAALSFLRAGKKDVTALYFNHGTSHGEDAEKFVREYCQQNNIPLIVERISRTKNKGESPEEYWRNCRYDFLRRYDPVITCHNLDDQVEQWIFTSLRGNPKLIPIYNQGVIRPFVLCRKSELVDWCRSKNVPYLVDPSNSDVKYTRNYIRKELVPAALKVNPGLYKTVARLVKENDKS